MLPVLLLLAAGCAAPPPAPACEGCASPLELSFLDCTADYVFVPADPEAVQAMLPEGYTVPAAFDAVLRVAECAKLVAGNTTRTGGGSMAMLMVPVRPPEAVASGADVFVLEWLATPGPEQLLLLGGIPSTPAYIARSGTLVLELAIETASHAYHATAAHAGTGPEAGGSTRLRYHLHDGRHLDVFLDQSMPPNEGAVLVRATGGPLALAAGGDAAGTLAHASALSLHLVQGSRTP